MIKRRASSPFTALTALAAIVSACAPTSEQPPQTPPAPTAAKPPSAPSPAEPDTSAEVDALVTRNVAARGGLDRLRAIRTLRLAGRARYGADGSYEVELAKLITRGGSIRYESTIQGITGVDAFDGKEGWSTDPSDGRPDPNKMSADDAKEMAQDADIDGPLVDWRAKGHSVAYLGIEDVDGTPAHKIRVKRKDGDVEYRYLDPDALLEIRVVKERRVRGVETIIEIDLGDYEQIAGVWMPLSAVAGRRGRPRTARIQWARADASSPADDALFRFPAPGTKAVRSLVLGPGAAVTPSAPPASGAAATPTLDGNAISGLGARNIGAAIMSGRIAAVAARHDAGKTTIYAGAASGGVWKSPDGGTTWRPVFDKNPVQSIGAVTLDPSRPETVWVGTGESWTRNSVSIGDGIYRSLDGGATWKNVGLPESERIVKIIVHPKNGDTVYVCVPGKLWSDSPDRGVYKTEDGGKRWTLALAGGNLSTGCSGLTMDPNDPEVLFAGMWDFRRKGWTYRSGGEGPSAPSASGLFRTADGGKTWTPLGTQTNKGLPAAPWGRVEVVIAPSDANIVYAFIESKDSALYRSSDGGKTWEARDKSNSMVWRPFYFAKLVVDPTNPDRLFKPSGALVVSEDGGKSFAYSGGGSHGDWHDLWINPGDPKHVIGGDDGGMFISHDGGNRWLKTNNLPISQFYHVSIDGRDPYNVYGGLQDNSSWVGPSAAPGGISNAKWTNLYGGDGFYAVVDPTDPEAVYVEWQGGFIGRLDMRTHAARDIQPKAGFKEKLRFNWNTPIHVSQSQKGTIYLGSQFLFRSKDRGDTWERASPDLTTNDPEKQKQELSGGITVDNSSAEMHTTIYSISESPRDSRTIWVGTDDGNLQVTRDGGKSWTNVVDNVPGLPKRSWVSWVEASRFDAAVAYAAFDRHTFGDMTPWVYKTTDRGQTWKRIASPAEGVRGYAHVVKEDVVSPDLLFVGTELGLFVSTDGGARWAEWRGGDFPSVAVREVQIHPREHDLVIGTHGRGIWIVDDITPLRHLGADVLGRDAAFLPSRPTQQRMPTRGGGWVEGDAGFVGQNPPSGAVITYYQKTRHLYGPLKLEVLDDKGKLIDTLDASVRRGINRVVWSMSTKPPRVPRGATVAYSASRGPRVLPGTYTLRLTKGKETLSTKLEVTIDRRAPYKLPERKLQVEAAMKAHALFEEMSALSDRIEHMAGAAEARAAALPAGDALAGKLRAARGKLEEARKKIVATKEGGAVTGEERLREHLDQLYEALLTWEGKPTKYQVERIEVLRRELAAVTAEVDAVVANDLKPLGAALAEKKLEPISEGGALSPRLGGLAQGAPLSRCLRGDCADPGEAAHKR